MNIFVIAIIIGRVGIDIAGDIPMRIIALGFIVETLAYLIDQNYIVPIF